MLNGIKADVVKIMMNVQVRSQQDVQAIEEPPPVSNVQYQHADYNTVPDTGAPEAAAVGASAAVAAAASAAKPFVRAGDKVGRNDPCPCGSGKKYKQCHGRL